LKDFYRRKGRGKEKGTEQERTRERESEKIDQAPEIRQYMAEEKKQCKEITFFCALFVSNVSEISNAAVILDVSKGDNS